MYRERSLSAIITKASMKQKCRKTKPNKVEQHGFDQHRSIYTWTFPNKHMETFFWRFPYSYEAIIILPYVTI